MSRRIGQCPSHFLKLATCKIVCQPLVRVASGYILDRQPWWQDLDQPTPQNIHSLRFENNTIGKCISTALGKIERGQSHTSTPCGRGKSGCLPAKHLKKACLELITIWTFHPEIISNSALSRYIHRCLFSNATILAVTGRGTGLIGNRWTIIYIAKFLGSKYDNNTKWKHDMFHSLLCC